MSGTRTYRGDLGSDRRSSAACVVSSSPWPLLATLGLAVATPAGAITNGVRGRERAPERRRPRRRPGLLRRHLDLLLRHADQPDGLPHGCALRRGRHRTGAGHVLLGVPGRRQDLLPAPSTPTRRTPDPRATRTTSPSSCWTRRSRASRRPRCPLPARWPSCRRPRPFTSVGYGAYEVTNSPGGHQYLYNDVRGVATGTLNSTNASWLRISMNPVDRQRRHLLRRLRRPELPRRRPNIVAATTITGDSVCRSTNVDYRLDTPSARAFLAAYVTPALTPPGAPAPSGVDHVYVVDGHLARRARLAR